MCSCPDAFLSLRSCAVEVVGVSGSMPVFGIGTVVFVIRTSADLPVVAMIHDCLLSQGSSFNLLSVSQFQSSGLNSVDFAVGSPHLSVTTAAASTLFPLILHEGLYNFSAEPILPNDDRFRTLPRFDWTSTSAFLSSPIPGVSPSLVSVPPWPPLPRGTGTPVLRSVPSSLGTWSLRLLAGSTSRRRINSWLSRPLVILRLIRSCARSVMASCPLLLRPLLAKPMILLILSIWPTSPFDSWLREMSVSVASLSSTAVPLAGCRFTHFHRASSDRERLLV